MAAWCSSGALLTTCTSCSRVVAMGKASMGSASVGHGSFMINMVTMMDCARIGC